MAVSYTCLTLQYVVVPTVLVLAALFRPAGISFVYLLMFFITPFIPIANSRNFKSAVGPFFIILIALCSLLLLCHIVLQVTIIAMKIESIFAMCSFTQQLLRHIGFINLQNLHPIAAAEWHLPDVLVFITVVISFVVIKKFTQKPPPITMQLETGEILPNQESDDSANADDEAFFDGLIRISPLFCLAMLFVIAVLRPSAPAGFYFLIFLLSGSYWATYNSLRRGFSLLLRLLMLVIALHSVCIVAYQTPWAQYYLSSDNLIARLIGLEPLVLSSCDRDIRVMSYNLKYSFDSFILPILMLLTYFVLALTAKCLSNANLVKRLRKSDAKEITSDEIALELQEANSPDVFTNTICDQICYGFISIGQFIYQNSYIFTNISMMTWSIIYHSWLTFVLLLWANILWMIPNQRKAMMRSSPFIVCYAELLLIAQYIYGMNLKNDELPSKVDTAGINLQQIGLERPQEHGTHPCVPLIVKTLFILMFWVTSRQFFQEKAEEKLNKRRTPVAMALETIDSETSIESQNKHTSKFLKKIGDIVKNLLVRLWIWMLVLVIFLCAMTGKFMTGFRICYMALFLFFLLVFQSSSKVWVKVMYGFWLFIIFYAMSMLILIYTYQFDKFDQYWYEYLNISQTLQNDIGLERYKTKDLFLHLVSPTLIVVLTVIQVHYFHRRFIEALQQRKPSMIPPEMVDNKQDAGKSVKTDRSSNSEATKLIVSSLKRIRNITRHYFIVSKKLFWRFLELHIIKAVYITAFVCCVSQICVIHVVFVALCVLGCITRSSVQIFISRIISFVVSVIILSKMIYQIGYLSHEDYDVKCEKDDKLNGNSALWFGLQKADDTTNGLIGLIKMYIIYMIVVTLHAVVSLRQFQMRAMKGNEHKADTKVLFPSTDRAKAETNLKSMIQYLFNYGFYKFGQEITLIMLVTTIAYRQDIIAIFYVIWLAVLLMFSRRRRSSVWGIFQVFVALSIFLQYLVLLGLPPSLCVDYPWEDSRFSASIQGWLLLPGDMHYDHSRKLIFDFILLLMITRQKRIFRIELRYGDNYAGGSNRNVVKDIENLGRVPFENPTRDFLSHVRNYLDIFMYVVLCGFFWVTLATVFLAGTNMSDFLTLGYLIGAFTFLWEGSDFYLRPIRQIISRWRWLLAYNVFNIVVKTCLEMGGCLFLKELTQNCCWLVHLLGISCHFSTEAVHDEAKKHVESDCPEVNKSTILMWDTICFAFLILQMRIFKSHYFCHLIIDTKANSILATRGAEIIEDLRQKQIEHRQQHENEILVKIKRNMERIRATQQKMLKPIDKPTHFDEHGAPSKLHKRKEIKLHGPAVRAGDYYMFEDVDDKFELDVIDDEQDFLSEQESEKKLQRRKTVIHTEIKRKSESEPSTSKEAKEASEMEEKKKKGDVVDSEESEDDLEANPIVRLLEGFLVTLTIGLHRLSRNYRYVNKIMSNEKRLLKETHSVNLVRRGGSSIFINIKGLSPNNSLMLEEDFTSREHHIIIEFLISLWYALLSNTDILCYLIVFINQVVNASIISLPLPLMVFLWGTLSLPRPTKTFWVTLIAYTQAIVLIKCIFQYKLIWANHENFLNEPLSPAKIFGVELNPNYASYDLLLLLVLFFHRFILKSHGLWKSEYKVPRGGTPDRTTQGIEKEKELEATTYTEERADTVAGENTTATNDNNRLGESDGIRRRNTRAAENESNEGENNTDEKRENGTENRKEGGADAREDNKQLIRKSSTDNLSLRSQRSQASISFSTYQRRLKHLKRAKYLSSVRKFFSNLLSKSRLPADVYALMFLCDFVNFFVLLFGFTSFGSQQSAGGVQTYLEENKVPTPFLIMLLVQFMLIVIDRALYLRKALLHKIIFHFLSVIGIHIWMFFIVPAVTERSFYSLAPPIIFYIIKCFYILLSSYQIKCGYPKRILGNFLTKSFSLINMMSFKVYMAIPFLYELRTILDWVCTDSTMTLFDWLKMEDIFADIYFIKCSRQMETDFPAIRATKKPILTKLIMGGLFITAIVFALWGPLCLFALINAVGQSNIPMQVSISIRIGSYAPIYQTNTRDNIIAFDDAMYSDLKGAYVRDRAAITFLSSYDASDIAVIKLPGNSPSLWNISPPDRNRLLEELKSNGTIVSSFAYSITRKPPDKSLMGTVSGEIIFHMNSTYAWRDDLINMLEANGTSKVVPLPDMVPKFIKILSSGDVSIVNQLMPTGQTYRPLLIRMRNSSSARLWWEIADYCDDEFHNDFLAKLPLDKCNSGIVLYTFNDKQFPSTFSFITKGGILGAYTTFVIVASRFFKSFIGGQNRKIMFEDMPYVDRVLQLCLDIYLVRQALEFALEEDLFAKLIFLYRSPETMIKWTRPKEEADDETDSESMRSRVSTRAPR